jgi:hypothetical protein
MKENLLKIRKGLFALLFLNIAIVFILSVFQSCSEGESFQQEGKFNETLNISIGQISNINLTKTNNVSSKSKLNDNLFLLKKSSNKSQTSSINELVTFDDAIAISVTEDFTLSNKPVPDYEIIDSFTIDEDKIIEALEPSVIEAKNVIKQNGISEEEINQILIETGATKEHLIPAIMLLNSIENSSIGNNASSFNLFVNSSFAQGSPPKFDMEKAKGCAIAALGLNLVDIARNITETGFKTALKATLKGVATKFMGPIGIAITVAEWAICYNGWLS